MAATNELATLSPAFRSLVELCLKCASLQQPQTRDAVINQLPIDFRPQLSRSPIERVDIVNLLSVCSKLPQGFEHFIAALQLVEGNSPAVQAIETALIELGQLQAHPTPESHSPADSTSPPAEEAKATSSRFSASTIDPTQALANLAELPLDTIPDVAELPAIHRLVLQPNPLFTGRDAELQALAKALKGGSTAVVNPQAAVTGLGGIGKTQLAVEFAHRYGQYFQGGVFWLNFADPNNVRAEIGQCSTVAGFITNLDASNLSLDNQIAAVQQEWNKDIPRLLIFDNCEDKLLIEEWRPKQGGCRVLVTSRQNAWAPIIGVVPIPIKELERKASIGLLESYFGSESTNKVHLSTIAELVGDLPLALHLSGSYLAEYRGIVTPEEYIQELRTKNLMSVESFSDYAQDHSSPTKYNQQVAHTFNLSYQRLNTAEPKDRIAHALFIRAAYFAPNEPIPINLLLSTLDANDRLDRKLCNKAARHLAMLGLIEQVVEGMRLHPLLAAFAQLMINDPAAQTAVEALIIEQFGNLNEVGYPPEMRSLQVHLRWITDKARERADLATADLCSMFGYHLYVMGQYAAAEVYLEQALYLHTQLNPDPNLARALSLNRWGVLLKAQGQYAEAQASIEKALHIREQVLGTEHPDTVMSLSDLAVVLTSQGKYKDGLVYQERALAIREDILGPNDLDTATSLSISASIYRNQGKYAEALPLIQRALSISEQALGPHHPTTATSLNSLASLYQDQGKYAEALPLFQRALSISEQALGPHHPTTAMSLNNLALLYRDQGKYAEALPLFQRSVSITEEALGPHHPTTAASLNNLALLYRDQGKYAEALPLFQRDLAITEQALGPHHRTTATSLSNLALVYRDQGKYAEALPLLQRALAITEQALGPHHPTTATNLNNLASIYREQGKYAEALPLFQRALSIAEQALGAEHPSTAISLNNLAAIYQARGQFGLARPPLERALAINKVVLGLEHPDTAQTIYNLGIIFEMQHNRIAAQRHYSQAYSIANRLLGPKHPNTKLYRQALGRVGG